MKYPALGLRDVGPMVTWNMLVRIGKYRVAARKATKEEVRRDLTLASDLFEKVAVGLVVRRRDAPA